jgi:hypothetical protein
MSCMSGRQTTASFTKRASWLVVRRRRLTDLTSLFMFFLCFFYFKINVFYIFGLIYSLIKQHADEPHLLFYGTQSTVNSVRCHQGMIMPGRNSGEIHGYYRGYKLLCGVGLVVRLRNLVDSGSGWERLKREQDRKWAWWGETTHEGLKMKVSHAQLNVLV